MPMPSALTKDLGSGHRVMDRLTFNLAAVAAFIFIVVSAAMNSLFLSSLGRTNLEGGLFAAISVASDLAKAILPIILLRALAANALARATIAGALLLGTIALSVCSGVGFASMTRGGITADRDSAAERLAQAKADLAEVEQKLTSLGTPRAAAIIEASLNTLYLDKRWQGSDECRSATWQQARSFCADILKLKTELAAAKEMVGLGEKRQSLRASIDAMHANGAMDISDPQSEALAQLSGTKAQTVRAALMILLAVVLELGSVSLLLLIAEPITQVQEKAPEQEAAPVEAVASIELVAPIEVAAPVEPQKLPVSNPASVPMLPDRSYWLRQRQEAKMREMRRGDA
jgi:hypothetical protein